MRQLPLAVALAALLLLPITALAQAEAEMSVEEARQAAQELRREMLDEAHLKELETTFRLQGADAASAAALAARVREHFEQLGTPVDLQLMTLERAEKPPVKMTEEQARHLAERLRAFYREQADARLRGQAGGEDLATRSSCYGCTDVLDDCLNVADGIAEDCFTAGVGAAWCLDLYRDLLRVCFDGFQACLNNCSV